MATTTAAVTLTSDLLSNAMSVSTTTTCMKAGTEADGLDQMDMGYIELPSGDGQKQFIDATARATGKANKVYICNESTDETYYVDIRINAMAIGKLYAGDWMFLPWSQSDTSASIEVAATNWTSSIGDIPVEYALFHEDTDFLTNA